MASGPLLSYRSLAERAARLAGHLRGTLGLAPGERVALFMANHPAYLELLYGAWWAGLAVVPINAKLHAREAAFILADAGAVGAVRRRGAGRRPAAAPARIARAAPGAEPRQRRLRAGPAGRHAAARTRAARRRRSGVAVLHLGHHRPAQGRDADAPQPAGDDARVISSTSTTCSADDAMVYAAPMSHGAGIYHFGFVAARGTACGAGLRRFRRRRAGGAVAQHRPAVPVRGADDGAPAGRTHRRQRRQRRRLQDHRLRRRADVRAGHAARARRHGPVLRADLRPGRITDDHHRAAARAPDRARAPALGRTHRLGGRGAVAGGSARGAMRRATHCPRARRARWWCAATP